MVKNIQTFSGGEKALIAISVLFAILKARTMPLCIFDEVEAALDQANVERFARYLSHYRGQSQFIAVTHRSRNYGTVRYVIWGYNAKRWC